MDKRRILIALCYLTLYVVWGSTYFFIKMAVETCPPYYVIALRFTVGGTLLLAFAALSGRLRARPTMRQVLASAFLGTLLLVGGNGLVTVAEQRVDSYLAALVIASTPMIVAAFDRVLLGKRLSRVRLAGIALGVLGVALLLFDRGAPQGGLSSGVWLVIAGVGCWGLATSLGHRAHTYPDPMVNSAIQMLFVGIASLVAVNVVYPPLPQVLGALSTRSALALGYLAIVGSLAFAAYTYLIAHEPAIRVTSYALVNPLIATLLGLVFGDERAVPFLAPGLPLILAGVALMLYGETVLARMRVRRAGRTPAAERVRVERR